jgi:hypothetical protein
MQVRRIRTEYADSAEIAIADMGSGRAADAIVFGPSSNKERISDVEDARFLWDEAAVDELRA